MGERPGSILFVCGMNAIRSPMAENLARHLFPSIFTQSAGVRCGERDPFVVAVMDEIGLDLSKHRPKELDELEDDYFDLIITLAPEAHHKALEFTRTMAVDVEYWPTQDPSLATGSRDQILDSYRQVRDLLQMKIGKRFTR
ncbi:arsenate reductase ArsC [Coralliovum pocilloporae]|uniref:arsenate reductase ArsC n=1 Tax=Coralliovum pocilloporae TaxID=3066369 RepID=UPI0033070481